MKEVTVKIPTGLDTAISKAQAKRHIEQMKAYEYDRVILDFTDIVVVGVDYLRYWLGTFSKDHPEIEIHIVEANDDVVESIKGMERV